MKELEKNKTIALVLGSVLLGFYIFNFIHPIVVSSFQMILTGRIVGFIIYLVIRVISTILCISIAKELNRSTTGWGVLGFVLPPITLIIISQLGENTRDWSV